MAFLIRKAAFERGSDSSGCLSLLTGLREGMSFSALFLCILFLCLSFSRPSDLRAEPLKAGEYQVKAAFLLNFANFVQWPNGAFRDDTFIIGILGQDSFGSAIDPLRGKTVKGRRVVVKRYDDPGDAREAAILFISGSEQRSLPHILRILRSYPVLTVGDRPGFGHSGVMINMRLIQKRVCFTINLAAAAQTGLEISSQLLKLAQEVIE